MEILHSTITFTLVFTTLYSYGFFILDRMFIKKNSDVFFKILTGYTFVGIIVLVLHFFFKINNIISLLIIGCGLIIFFVNFSKLHKKEFLFSLIIVILFSFIFFGYSDHPIDTNMYHHPYVSYLKSEKIIFAITNIQFRFGHISFLQYVQAAVTNDFLHLISLASINIIFFICFIHYMGSKIIGTKYFDFNFIVKILFTSFLLIKFARYREYGNDLIPLLVCIYFLIQLLELNKNKYFSKNELVSISFPFVAFMFAHKISYTFGFLMFLPIFSLKIIELIKKIEINYLFVFSLILFPWILKNLITTSCFAYPVEITCFSNSIFELQGIAQPSQASWLTEIWAKGFIDHPNWKELDLNEYKSGFNWVNTWLNGHFIKILEIMSPLFLIILIFTLYLIINKKKFFSKKNNKRGYLSFWITIFIGLTIWFYNAPIYRYGSFYIISFVILSYVLILKYFYSEKKNYNINFFKVIFVISLSFCLIKNIIRMNESNLKLFPKTVDVENKKIFKISGNEDLKIYNVKNGLCFYSKFICSHEIPDNIKIKKFNNYYILME
tara:strand:+ start:8 stop:1663 length:1656 start_codon:yes stop_codon:yes gene_type:complete